MEENSPTSHDGGLFENPTASVIIWLFAGVMFLVCPFVSNRDRRNLCAARIRQRRWNVEGHNRRDWYREAANRLEERSRHRRESDEPVALSVEEEEDIRNLFLIQQLSAYTMTLASSDIKMKDKAESADVGTNGEDIENDPAIVKPLGSQHDTDSDDEHDTVDEYEETDRIVTVLASGESVWPLDTVKTKRDCDGGCAICLSQFDPRDQVTWSANRDCHHVFHSDCILQWLLALGRKERKRRLRHPERSTGDPLKDVVNFRMKCPCCRQQFVNIPEEAPSLTLETSTTDDLQSGTVSSDELSTVALSTDDSPREEHVTTATVVENV